MELRWWPVLVIGILGLATVISVVMLTPTAKNTRALRPLAHVDRLTTMPEYIRVARIRFWSMLVTLVLLFAVFAVALLSTSRPVGLSSASRHLEAEHPEDIMLCVGQPVTDPTTAGFLNYFTQRIRSFRSERIGLTSPTLRVVPMTHDYDYAATQFSRLATLTSLQRDADRADGLPGPQADELRTGVNDFSRSVAYSDYGRSTEDVLALCLAGFPSFEEKSTRRRSLIFLGYSSFQGPNNSRRSLFSDQRVKDMATTAGVQINVINRADVVKSPAQASEALNGLVAATGGRYATYNPAGTASEIASGTDSNLAAMLDRIRDNPPNVLLPSGNTVTRRSWDDPNVPLLVSVVAAGLLFLSLAVLRR